MVHVCIQFGPFQTPPEQVPIPRPRNTSSPITLTGCQIVESVIVTTAQHRRWRIGRKVEFVPWHPYVSTAYRSLPLPLPLPLLLQQEDGPLFLACSNDRLNVQSFTIGSSICRAPSRTRYTTLPRCCTVCSRGEDDRGKPHSVIRPGKEPSLPLLPLLRWPSFPSHQTAFMGGFGFFGTRSPRSDDLKMRGTFHYLPPRACLARVWSTTSADVERVWFKVVV